MPDQADSLRRQVLEVNAAPEAERQGLLLLVFGVDPAVAARGLGLQLALAWLRRHDSAALVEIARQLPGWFNSTPAPIATLADVVRQQRTLREAWRTGPCGLRVIGGELADPNLTATRPLRDQLRIATQQQRVVVNAETLDDLRAFLPAADHCLFVTSAETDRLTATYQAIKSVAGDLGRARCWLAITQATDQATAEELQDRIITVCDRCLNLALSPLGTLPTDPSLAADHTQRPAVVHLATPAMLRRELEQMIECLEAAHQYPSCTPLAHSSVLRQRVRS
jgi:MinD-like ATPase involved in chromosome partitioning or flagellar assembly